MIDTDRPQLTAGDLMSRDVETISANLSLSEAAARLARREIHGAPVVDDTGRCIGVLSVTDLARWAARQGDPVAGVPQTCAFQDKHREPGGRESALCRLAEGVCPMQRLREMPNGEFKLACIEPNSVPVDWQTVELGALPSDSVRDYMTTTVFAVDPTEPVAELARIMLDHQIHRLLVLDSERRPIGIVTVNDLLQVLAHPEIVAPGAAQ